MLNRVARYVGRVAVLGALAFALAGCGINAVPTQDEQVKAAWSEVLNQYQRRADLVPNLVATVKGYAKQEQTVFTQVTEARAKATQMVLPDDILSNPKAFQQFEQNQAQLGGALGRLLAVSEAYPDLKSSQNFLALQSQLEGTENRISVARRDYIEALGAGLTLFLAEKQVLPLAQTVLPPDVAARAAASAAESEFASLLVLGLQARAHRLGLTAAPSLPVLADTPVVAQARQVWGF